jgi:methylated-DNA-protein-cysteine methyltransferase-like protein
LPAIKRKSEQGLRFAVLSLTTIASELAPQGSRNVTDEAESPAQIRRTALYLTLAQIPEGKVVSYGQLAELAGLGRAARWVGRTLSQLPGDTRLPWHRVLGAGGRISLPVGSPSGDEQRARLRAEGISVLNNRVDIQRHGWRPVEHSG